MKSFKKTTEQFFSPLSALNILSTIKIIYMFDKLDLLIN